MIKRVRQTIKNKAKEQRERFLGMLLDTSSASSLGNLLTGKGSIVTSQGRETDMSEQGTIRAAEETTRAGQDF